MTDNSFHKLYARIYNWIPSTPYKSKVIDLPALSCVIGTTGGKSRENNQDQVLAFKVMPSANPKNAVIGYVVLDGMGGMRQGLECSKIAAASFIAALVQSNELTLVKRAREALEAANRNVFEAYSGLGGTTLSAVLANSNLDFVVAHVGDSRVYTVRAGRCEQVSFDDTVNNSLSKALNKSFSDKNGEQLIQFVGMGPDFQPHVDPISHGMGSEFLIMSDGAYAPISQKLQQIVGNSESTEETVKRILEFSEWCGGLDNASVSYFSPKIDNFFRMFDLSLYSSLEIHSTEKSIELQGQLSFKANIEQQPSKAQALEDLGLQSYGSLNKNMNTEEILFRTNEIKKAASATGKNSSTKSKKANTTKTNKSKSGKSKKAAGRKRRDDSTLEILPIKND